MRKQPEKKKGAAKPAAAKLKKKTGAPLGNKNAIGNDGGAPTKYKPEYAQQAYKMCLLGYTYFELSVFFEVDEGTIKNWMKEHLEFFTAVNEGKEIADGEVAKSFFKRAVGYDFEEVTYEKVLAEGEEEADVKKETWKKRVTKKHLPPDAGAALNWLKNRQKKKWRDKIEHGLTNNEGDDVITMYQIPNNGRSENNQTAGGVSGKGAQLPG